MTAPSVFSYTAPSNPERYRQALAIFQGKEPGASVNVRDEDVGAALRDEIQKFLDIVEVPRGLSKLGYTSSDVSRLVEGCLPQRRVLDLAPYISKDDKAQEREQLSHIVEESMSW